MGTKQLKPRALDKTMRQKQLRHAELLARVERTAARLDRRKSKLLALETEIAGLERQSAERNHKNGSAPLPPDRKVRHAQLVFNPSSGKDEKNNALRLAEVVSALRTHGIEPNIGVKTSGKAARELARQAVKSRLPLVIVAAGDGTVEDVASQLIGSSTALGIVPLGTMNNVARSLGIPIDIAASCALIGMGTTRHIDVGRVFSNDQPQIEYFLEGAGVGLSAIAALAGQSIEKRRWHLVPDALRRFFSARPGVLRVAMDDEVIEVSSRIVTVSNAPMMGNNMMVAPEAKMDDGYLDVVVYDGMGDAALVKHFMAAANGNPDRLKSYRSRHVRITSSEPLPSNSDKDVVARRQVIDIEIAPRALAVIAGNGMALSVPVEAAPSIAVPEEAPHENGHTEALAGQQQPSQP